MLESNGKDMHVSYRHRDTRARRFNRQDVLGWYEKEKKTRPTFGMESTRWYW